MHIVPILGNKEINDVSKRDIQDFILLQKRTGNVRNGARLSASSINMMITVLKLAFEYACDMDYIKDNPCERIRRIKNEAKKIEAFTAKVQRALEKEIAH